MDRTDKLVGSTPAPSFPPLEQATSERQQIDAIRDWPVSRDSRRAMFAPLHYESGYAYPLVVWLHSPGPNNEQQLLRVMPLISVRNYVAVAPRGFSARDADRAGFPCDWPQTDEHIFEAERRILAAIRAASRKYHIARHRVFLAGFHSGGTMAFRMAMDYPDRFAGVISLCGPFPRTRCPLRRLPDVRQLSVFLAVGRESTDFNPPAACDDLRLFHTAGISVSLRQYPCGQELIPQMLRDVDRWLIEQITSGTANPGGQGTGRPK